MVVLPQPRPRAPAARMRDFPQPSADAVSSHAAGHGGCCPTPVADGGRARRRQAPYSHEYAFPPPPHDEARTRLQHVTGSSELTQFPLFQRD